MGDSKRVSQESIEQLLSLLFRTPCSAACKMAVFRLVEASEGLTKSIRVCIQSDYSQRTPEIVEEYKALLPILNSQVDSMSLSGQFKWGYHRESYTLWYSHDSETEWNEVEREVGDLTGENFLLAIRALPNASKGRAFDRSVGLDPSNRSEIRPTYYCSPHEALAVVNQLHELMPDMRLTHVMPDSVPSDAVLHTVLFLLRSNDGHRRLKEGT